MQKITKLFKIFLSEFNKSNARNFCNETAHSYIQNETQYSVSHVIKNTSAKILFKTKSLEAQHELCKLSNRTLLLHHQESVRDRYSFVEVVVVEAKAQLELVVVRQSNQVVSALHVLPEPDFLRQLHDVRKSLGGVRAVALQDVLLEPVDCQHAVSHVFGFVVANHLEVFLQRLVVDVEVLDSVTDDRFSVRVKKMLMSKSA